MSKKKLIIFTVLLIFLLLISGCVRNNQLPPPDSNDSQSLTDGETLLIDPGKIVDHDGTWSDFILRFSAKRNGEGSLGISFHANPEEGAYILLFDSNGFILQKEFDGHVQDLAVFESELRSVEWHQLELEMLGGDIRVFYFDEMVIEHNDSDPLLSGGISFETMGDLSIKLMDVDVESLGTAQNEELTPALEISESAEATVESETVEATATQAPDAVETELAPALPISELEWVRLGGPSGGTGYDIRYNPDDPNIWYVTDANSGVNISTDNGLTWKESNEGLPGQSGPTADAVGVFCLTIDPHDSQTIWIGTLGTGHIYRSTNGGQTWEERDNGISLEYDQLTFRGFTVDPRSSDIVYVMGETDDESLGGPTPWLGGVGGVIYKTIDAGENWTKIWDGGMPSSLARYMWINPDNPDVLYVSTGIFDRSAVGEALSEDAPFGGLGILKSTDGGQTWRILNEDNGLRNLYIVCLDLILLPLSSLISIFLLRRIVDNQSFCSSERLFHIIYFTHRNILVDPHGYDHFALVSFGKFFPLKQNKVLNRLIGDTLFTDQLVIKLNQGFSSIHPGHVCNGASDVDVTHKRFLLQLLYLCGFRNFNSYLNLSFPHCCCHHEKEQQHENNVGKRRGVDLLKTFPTFFSEFRH